MGFNLYLRPSRDDPRSRICGDAGEGGRPCERIIADGDNPLKQCDEHRALFFARIGRELPPECPACSEPVIGPGLRIIFPVGAMCFACGVARGGTVATEAHRGEARAAMRAKLIQLLHEGDRGAEWAATLARCPADIRAAIERRIAKVTP